MYRDIEALHGNSCKRKDQNVHDYWGLIILVTDVDWC